MTRYLLFFSYIGTRFCGMQRQLNLPTVQDAIDSAIGVALRTKEAPRIRLSSRTDSGVHAVRASAHVDLLLDSGYARLTKPQPLLMRRAINKRLARMRQDVRLLDVVPVSSTFSANYHARSRTYVYRIGVIRQEGSLLCGTSPLPVLSSKRDRQDDGHPRVALGGQALFEADRCHFIIKHDGIDEEAFCRAATLLSGTHNFLSFSMRPGDASERAPRDPIRHVECSVRRGVPFVSGSALDGQWGEVDYYEIRFRSSGFLYRQVRKMAGALVQVGRGRLSEDTIGEMLGEPSIERWHRQMRMLPPHGLYLCDVEYRADEMAIPLPREMYKWANKRVAFAVGGLRAARLEFQRVIDERHRRLAAAK